MVRAGTEAIEDVSTPENPGTVEAGAIDAHVFIARQPIYDRWKSTYGYELLCRSGLANVFDHADADQASLQIIADSQLLFGLSRLAAGKRAFINFTRETLIQGYAFVLSRDSLVVEIGEDVTLDTAVIDACHQLKRAGYLLALDGARAYDLGSRLLLLANMVKVDFQRTDAKDRRALAVALGPKGIPLVAKKVETADEYAEALQAGYSYFQGRFCSDPVILSRKDVPAFKLTQVGLLRELNHSTLDRARLQALIKHDAVAVFKLLRFVNSAALERRRHVESIEHAMSLLGDDALRKFLLIMTLRTIASDGPRELAVQCAIRGVFCESLAGPAGLDSRANDLFTVGLFSLLAPIMRRPLPELLEDVAIARDVKRALLGDSNPLRDVLLCVLAYECGEWEGFSRRARELGVAESVVPALYARALEHATLLTSYEDAASR